MDSFARVPVSRRGLLGGAFAAAAGLFVAGCSDSSPSGSGGGVTATLRIGLPSDILLNSVQRFQPQNQPLRRTVFDYLVDRKPDGSYKPALATAWQWSADKTTLKLTLRDGVTYHSGRPFGPDDVIATIKAATAPGAGAQAGKLLQRAKSVQKSGPHEVTVTFDKPFPAYLDGLAMLPVIDSQTFGSISQAKQVVGTGPYTFKSWTPGSKLVLARNDKYWGGKPNIATLEFTIITEPQAMLAAMRAGNLEMALRLVARDAASLKSDARFSVSTTAPYEIYLGANTKVKPLDDIRVRQALAYSIDRKRITDQVYRGFASASAIPWDKDTPGVSPAQIDSYGYDPAKAKALLAQAGATGVEVAITSFAADPTMKAIQDVVQFGMTESGFKPKPVVYDAAQWPKHIQAGDMPGVWITDVALTAMGQVTALLTANPLLVGKNTSNFTAPEYADLVGKLVAAADEQAQATASKALTDYMLEQAFHNSIVQAQSPVATVKKLSGITTDLTLAPDFTKATLQA